MICGLNLHALSTCDTLSLVAYCLQILTTLIKEKFDFLVYFLLFLRGLKKQKAKIRSFCLAEICCSAFLSYNHLATPEIYNTAHRGGLTFMQSLCGLVEMRTYHALDPFPNWCQISSLRWKSFKFSVWIQIGVLDLRSRTFLITGKTVTSCSHGNIGLCEHMLWIVIFRCLEMGKQLTKSSVKADIFRLFTCRIMFKLLKWCLRPRSCFFGHLTNVHLLLKLDHRLLSMYVLMHS